MTLADLSGGMVRRSMNELREHGFVDGGAVVDVQSLPFVDGAFDVVVANHMLYHVPDRARAIVEIARVVRPGGTLYATTNGADHMLEMHAFAQELDPGSGDVPASKPFSLENGVGQLAECFSAVERIDYVDGLRVTDSDAIVAYLLSGMVRPSTPTADFRRRLAERIERKGAIDITKSAGVFVARKA